MKSCQKSGRIASLEMTFRVMKLSVRFRFRAYLRVFYLSCCLDSVYHCIIMHRLNPFADVICGNCCGCFQCHVLYNYPIM